MSEDLTFVWSNPITFHQYEEGPLGNLLNGQPCETRPDWVDSVTPITYGAVIPWGGGECPLDPSVLVRCFFRGRTPYVGKAIWDFLPSEAAAAMWQHAPFGKRFDETRDITAYQVRLA